MRAISLKQYGDCDTHSNNQPNNRKTQTEDKTEWRLCKVTYIMSILF